MLDTMANHPDNVLAHRKRTFWSVKKDHKHMEKINSSSAKFNERTEIEGKNIEVLRRSYF